MLRYFLLGLLLHNYLSNCNEDRGGKFNESQLMEMHHQHFLKANAFLMDTYLKRNDGGSVLRAVDYEHEPTRDDQFLDYSITNLWWNGTPGIHQTDELTKLTSFLPTPEGFGRTSIEFTTTRYPRPPMFPSTFPTRGPDIEDGHPYPYPGFQKPADTKPKPGGGPDHQEYPYDLPYPPHRPSPGPMSSHYSPGVGLSSDMTRPSYPFTVPPYTTVVDVRHQWNEFHTGQYPPGHPSYVPTTYNPHAPWTSKPSPGKGHTYPSYYSKPNHFGPPVGSEMPHMLAYPSSSNGPRSKGPTSFPEVPGRPKPTEPPFSLRTHGSGQGSSSSGFSTQITKPPTSFTKPNSEYMDSWFHENTYYTAIEKWLLTLTTPAHNLTTTQERKVRTTLSKAQAWVRSVQLKKNVSRKHTPSVHRQGIELPTEPILYGPEYGDYLLSTATAKQEEFLLADEHGFVFLGTTPKYDEHTKTTIIDGRPAYIPFDPTPPSTAGDVLMGGITVAPAPVASSIRRYYDMMYDIDEGYMMVFLLELTKLIALKKPKDVQDVIIHMETITNELFQNARIAWFGQPLVDVTMKLGQMLTEGELDLVRSYSSMMYHMLQERKQALAVDVNSIIDYADLLYEDAEGELLFITIKEFEDFPNITKTSRELCDALVDNFLRPFRRLYHSERRQALLDSINYALKTRFPQFTMRRSNEESLMVSSGENEDQSTQEESQIHTTTFQSRKMRKKHQEQSYKRNLDRKRNKKYRYTYSSDESIYRRQHEKTAYYPVKRSIKPDTQKRIRAIRPKPFRGIKVRKTDEIEYDFSGRQRKPQERANIQSLQSRREEAENLRNAMKAAENNKISIYRHMNERLKESETEKHTSRVKLKTEVLRRIVEVSSYSDEEASLKNNLIQALHGNRSFDIDGGNTKSEHGEGRT